MRIFGGELSPLRTAIRSSRRRISRVDSVKPNSHESLLHRESPCSSLGHQSCFGIRWGGEKQTPALDIMRPVAGARDSGLVSPSAYPQLPLSEVGDDLSRYLRPGETEEVAITHMGSRPGC